MKIHRVVQMLGATTSTGKLADDMYDLNYKDYYSKAEDRYIPISHMDFQHMVRAFVKQNEEDVRSDTQEGKYDDLKKQNEDLVSANRQLAKQHDIWKEKAMNMMDKSSYDDIENTLKDTIKANSELIQLNKQLKDSLRQVNLTPTVSTEAYDIAWKQVDYWKKLAEDNFIQSVDDSETSDTWKERYEHEVKIAEYWKDLWNTRVDNLRELPKGCGYTFSEIPNDTDGQEFVDTMKKYFNKKSYKMRVRGQHIKPELRGTGATAYGQNIDESTHMRVYIDAK